ncbi:hypothetical protein SCATT_p13490 (plasmid) [Streptantibioticus cattleyicolor NRRL 8057 = DSM 46488]|uniref:Tetratricopeptide repeat protein n=1 Tax=Streptantibioticus cattleyicolor (strain ATCC 35852 / DSM 46488 / JCM 4925 / NBRC 14057 / NRRL 8057) TaxID=1003195 RepID=G8XFT1_STREN|nr:hypothetical protein SCATT_p13490 [Streptantibioticus cattleyicolor NRRL 8057 = DSM 46488]
MAVAADAPPPGRVDLRVGRSPMLPPVPPVPDPGTSPDRDEEEPMTADPTMDAIGRAVAEGRAGDAASARRQLLELWAETGVTGDPLHRCTLAHHLADFYPHPARALVWDVRALDAADAVTDQRVQAHHAGLRIAGFSPSLHLNLADDHRRLGSFDAAAEHVEAAEAHAPAFPRARTATRSAPPYGRWPRPSPGATPPHGPPPPAPPDGPY